MSLLRMVGRGHVIAYSSSKPHRTRHRPQRPHRGSAALFQRYVLRSTSSSDISAIALAAPSKLRSCPWGCCKKCAVPPSIGGTEGTDRKLPSFSFLPLQRLRPDAPLEICGALS